jgi:predicted nucleic acid binding AN1-type Zn finger protein
MEFADLGAHCSIQDCYQQDFLPFRCDACNLVYCRSHRGYSEHQCTRIPMGEQVQKCPVCNKGITLVPGQNINITISQHMDSSACKPDKASLCPRCKIKLTGVNTVTCNKCRQQLCLAHRFPDQHSCTHPLERKMNAMGFKCPRCATNFPKSADLIQHMRFEHIENK